MIADTDVHLASRNTGTRHLRMTTQTHIEVALGQHLGVNGPVWGMAHRAAFAKRRVFENKRTALLAVTLAAGLVQPGHGKSARRLIDVCPVRVMTLGAVHFVFRKRMVLGQLKLRLYGAVALVAGAGVLAGVYNKLAPPPAGGNVQTGRSVAGLATGLSEGERILEPNPGMRAGREDPCYVGVTFGAGFISHKRRPGNLRS